MQKYSREITIERDDDNMSTYTYVVNVAEYYIHYTCLKLYRIEQKSLKKMTQKRTIITLSTTNEILSIC